MTADQAVLDRVGVEGSALWGVVAEVWGLRPALVSAAALLVLTLFVAPRWRLAA